MMMALYSMHTRPLSHHRTHHQPSTINRQTYPLLPRGNGGPDAALRRAQVRCVAEVINAGIQPLQNLSVMNKISAESGGAYDGKIFGKDAIAKCV